MNAVSLITAKGLILALGGSLSLSATPTAPPAPAAPSYVKVDLGATATHPLTGTYLSPPTGAVTLGSVPFNMANIALLTSGTTLDLPAVVSKPASVSVLVNSAYGYASLQGKTVGRVHLTFSDGTAQDTDIVAGALVREWWLGNGYLTTLSGAAANVWQGQGNPATGIGTTPAVIDMLTATVKTTTANLTGVSVQNLAGAPFDLQLSGVTVASNPATPTPTPVCRSNSQQRGAFNGENPGHCDPKPTSSTPKPVAKDDDKAEPAVKPKATPTPKKPIVNTKKASQDETKHDETSQHSDGGHQRD